MYVHIRCQYRSYAIWSSKLEACALILMRTLTVAHSSTCILQSTNRTAELLHCVPITHVHPSITSVIGPKSSPVAYHIHLRHQSSALKPRYARPTYHYSHHPDVSLRLKFQCFSCHSPPLSLSARSQSSLCSTLPSPVLGAEN